MFNLRDDDLGSATPGYDLSDGAVLARVPTPTEQRIQDALQRTDIVGGAVVRVGCVPDEFMRETDTEREDGFIYPKTVHAEVPVVHIRQSVCDTLVSYAQDPDKSDPTYMEALALNAVVHEGVHVRTKLHVEARVNCYAYQEIPKLAAALGADPVAAQLIQQEHTEVYYNQPARYQTRDCHDGGPWDLQPAVPGNFPFASPE